MNSKAQTALRIELDLLNRAALLVPVLRQDPLVRALGQVSRSSVLRIALAKGLDLCPAAVLRWGTLILVHWGSPCRECFDEPG